MGIPRLLNHLQPYAETVTYAYGSQERKAVIDGPGLAYHVYHKVLALRREARSAFEAAPTYQELGDAAVLWLQLLSRYGFHIEAIYFDGALPAWKTETRMQRLQQYLDQLIKFKANHIDSVPYITQPPPPLKDEGLFMSLAPPARATSLPALTFLVPAVLEALLRSESADVTAVISGEADSYCAEHVRINGGTVFTSDSDLLVHDLGKDGSIVLFRDIELTKGIDSHVSLTTMVLSPSAIAQRLGLKTLMPFGYALKENTHRSLSECVRLALAQPADDKAYQTFCAEYTVSPSGPTKDEFSSATQEEREQTRKVLNSLDPRVSEYVQAIAPELSLGTKPKPIDSISMDGTAMYLPFIIDDPSRASAWQISLPLRKIAYNILHSARTKTSAAREFEELYDIHIAREVHRRGTKMALSDPIMYSMDRCLEQCGEISHKFVFYGAYHDAASTNGLQSEGLLWRLIALRFLVSYLSADAKPLPTKSEFRRLAAGLAHSSSWIYVHFSAQMQTILYSLRVLKQMIDVFFLIPDSRKQRMGKVRKAVEGLQRVLATMPGLAELFEPSKEDDDAEAELDLQMTALAKVLDLAEETVVETPAAKKKRKRKSKQDEGGSKVPARVPAKVSNNMYTLLSREQ